jgi:hypothetical protein
MSMQAMQAVLWRGASDPDFLATLLGALCETLEQFDLTQDELTALTATPVSSLLDLAHTVEAWRRGDHILAPVRGFALAS